MAKEKLGYRFAREWYKLSSDQQILALPAYVIPLMLFNRFSRSFKQYQLENGILEAK